MTQDTQLATTGRRTAAMAIDSIVLSLFVLILFYDSLMSLSAGITTATTPESMQNIYDQLRAFNRQSLPYVFVLYLLYHGLLIWQSGMTLGKYIMKIKIVNQNDGGQLDLSKSMIRAFVRTLGELFLFYLTFLPAFFNPLRQTFQDKLAGSVAIDTRAQR